MEINASLFQEMSANYSEMFHFPPITSQIFTLMLFDFDQTGLTFEEIQEQLNASKSTVSNALNRLLQTHHIEFFNKMSERKRFYRINREIFMVQFQDEFNQMKKNKNILERYAAYRKQKTKDDFHTDKLNLHIRLLEAKIHLHQKTMNEISNLNQNQLYEN